MFSVKTIFKTLIGTIVLITVSSFIVEIFNCMTTGLQINQLTRLACKQSCTLFSQESYKKRVDNESGDSGGTIATNPVRMRTANGGTTVVHNGDFYGSGDAATIYRKLYGPGSDFVSWVENDPAAIKGNWKNVNLIKMGLTEEARLRGIPFNPNDNENREYTEAQLALLYADVMMTPLNLGIPYLDKSTVESIFRWNLAELLSNCNPDLIYEDDWGNVCVNFKGFVIYPMDAEIIDINYQVYNLTQPSDRAKFNKETNINPDKLAFGDTVNMDVMSSGGAADERQRICIAGIQYKIPIEYKGITPIAKIYENVWNSEVEGLEGQTPNNPRDSIQPAGNSLVLGGFASEASSSSNEGMSAGTLPIPGNLTFYLVR